MAEGTHERHWVGSDLEIRAASDGLTIAGYMARFNEPAPISDFLGDYVETIAPGAFRQTLRERGAGGIKMQFAHGRDPVFGTLPIGAWTTLREDKAGLYAEGRIHDTWRELPIRAAIESGALDGMSFSFKSIGEQWRQGQDGAPDQRTLTEIALFEGGPVVYPAYVGTTVGIRARALDLLRSAAVDPCATIDDDEARDGAESVSAEHDSPVGVTRREMRLAALSRIGVIHEPNRGAA